MATVDALEMVSRACIEARVPPPSSLTDDDANGEPIQLAYDSVTEFLLGVYPFDWAMQWFQLSQVSGAVSMAGYQYEYQLPSERTGLPKQYTDDITCRDRSFTDLLVNGNRVHSDAATLYARCPIVPDPKDWPSVFRRAHTLALASTLANSVPNNSKLANELYERAFGTKSMNFRGGAMGAAIHTTSQNTPSRRLLEGSNPMLASWRGASG